MIWIINCLIIGISKTLIGFITWLKFRVNRERDKDIVITGKLKVNPYKLAWPGLDGDECSYIKLLENGVKPNAQSMKK